MHSVLTKFMAKYDISPFSNLASLIDPLCRFWQRCFQYRHAFLSVHCRSTLSFIMVIIVWCSGVAVAYKYLKPNYDRPSVLAVVQTATLSCCHLSIWTGLHLDYKFWRACAYAMLINRISVSDVFCWTPIYLYYRQI